MCLGTNQTFEKALRLCVMVCTGPTMSIVQNLSLTVCKLGAQKHLGLARKPSVIKHCSELNEEKGNLDGYIQRTSLKIGIATFSQRCTCFEKKWLHVCHVCAVTHVCFLMFFLACLPIFQMPLQVSKQTLYYGLKMSAVPAFVWHSFGTNNFYLSAELRNLRFSKHHL